MAKAPAKTEPQTEGPGTAVVESKPNRPLTRSEQNKVKMGQMLEGVANSRGDLERFLKPQGIDFDFFHAGLQVALMNALKNDEEFFSVTADSFFTAVYKAARDGLICDGREAAIARFGTEATYMPMVAGFVKKAHETGMIESIITGAVTEDEEKAGRFEYVEGDGGYIKHMPLMSRKAGDRIVAAYAIVRTTNGGVYREVVPEDDLKKMRALSKAKKGPRVDWAIEMDRKGALRRVFKLIPHHKALKQLLEHDEQTYLPTPRADGGEETKPIPTQKLFAAKAEHTAEEPKTDSVKTVKTKPAKKQKPKAADPDEAPNQGPLIDEMLKSVKAAANLGELAEAIHDLKNHKRKGDLTEASQKIINDACLAKRAELTPQDEPEGDPRESDDAPAELPGLIPAEETKRPPLEVILRTGGSPKVYEHEIPWRDAILAKMDTLTGGDLKAFWTRNAGFIQQAKDNGYAEADRVFAFADRKGLI